MLKQIKKFDWNEVKLPIFINNRKGLQTLYGGITTILIIILSTLIIFAFGKDLLEKKTPIVTASQDYVEFPVIKKNDIKIAFSAFYGGGFPIENFTQYLNFTLMIAVTGYDKEKPTTYLYFNMRLCNEDEVLYESFNKEGVFKSAIGSPKNYFCINGDTENMTDIEGMWGDCKFKVWTLLLKKCRNSTENNYSCKPTSEIDLKLNTFYFHIINTNFYLDSNDLKIPLKSTFHSNLYRISSLNSRMIISKFRLIDFKSDEGLMQVILIITQHFKFQIQILMGFINLKLMKY